MPAEPLKFDAVVANPPYQELKEGNAKTRMIWQDFVLRAIDLLEDGGSLAMIHPSTWRGTGATHPPEIGKARAALKGMDMSWLSMTSVADSGRFFKGVGIAFDHYAARKTDTPGFATGIEGTDGSARRECVKGMDFIPNFHCGDLDRILAKEGEERVDFVYSRVKFESRKMWMSRERKGAFVHPCVHAVSRNAALRGERGGRLKLMWSNARDPKTKNPSRAHFGVPKVIFGKGNQSGIPHADMEGRYGMTQYNAAIADDPGILPLIARAMDGSRFRRAMESVRFTTEEWNPRVIPLLRRDFWKEFVDAGGAPTAERG